MKKLFFAFLILQLALSYCCTKNNAYALPPYSISDFNGTYGFGLSGTIVFLSASPGAPPCSAGTPVSLPTTITGTFTADGKGGLGGTQTVNTNGLVCSGTLAGTYTVNSDGTGALKDVAFTPNAGSPKGCEPNVSNSSFAFSNGGAHIDVSGTDCFEVISGTATKQ